MKIKKRYENESEIPDELKVLYTESGDAWVLKEDLEFDDDDPLGGQNKGVDPKKFDEFRTTNRELKARLKEKSDELGRIQKQFEGIDAEKYHKWSEEIQKAQNDRDRSALMEGKIDEVMTRRVQQAIAAKTEELESRTKAYEELQKKHASLVSTFSKREAERAIHRHISEKGLKIKKGALDDLNRRIGEDWHMGEEEEKLVPRNDLYGEDGGQITPEEYVTRELLQRRSFFFEGASGGGSTGGDGDVNTDGKIKISRNDMRAKGKHLEDMAKGKVKYLD